MLCYAARAVLCYALVAGLTTPPDRQLCSLPAGWLPANAFQAGASHKPACLLLDCLAACQAEALSSACVLSMSPTPLSMTATRLSPLFALLSSCRPQAMEFFVPRGEKVGGAAGPGSVLLFGPRMGCTLLRQASGMRARPDGLACPS